MYAVIETGGKQYRVEVGTELEVEHLDVEVGSEISLDRILLVADGDKAAIGRPVVENATVKAEVVRRDRGEKVISWEDFQTGLWHGEGRSETILDRPDNREVALPIPRSNALKFRLESGAFAAFRPSGTEPKLKVYLQSRTDTALLDRMESEARTLLGL